MRLHFQERPLDLYAAMGYTVVMAAVLVILDVGSPIAIVLVLFVPGYVMVAALFPGSLPSGRPKVDWLERIALSFGLSIALIPLLGLLLSATPWGLRYAPIIATITVFVVGVGYTAYWRRMQLPPGLRLSGTLEIGIPAWHSYKRLDKVLSVALVTSIVVAAAVFVHDVLGTKVGQRSTEFYVLGPGGNGSGYPTVLNVTQPGTVITGIANHESETVNYTVRVDLVGVRLIYNATSGHSETVEVNRTTWSMINVTLADDHNWTQPYTFKINYTGLWKVQFLLFKGPDLTGVYGEFHFYVTVK